MLSVGLTQEQENIILSGKGRVSDALRILRLARQAEGQGVTSDECLKALQLDHASGSARFSELMGSGCLVATGQKRRTRAGGLARVCAVAPEASFVNYLNYIKNRCRRAPKGVSLQHANIISAGETFIKQWHKVKTKESQAKAVRKLIQDLLSI